MDPNETLRLIRETIAQMRTSHPGPEIKAVQADEIADNFEALDEWLSRGGLLPEDWA